MAAPERRHTEVSAAFGSPAALLGGDADDGTTTTTAREDMDLVRRTLQGFNDGGTGFLRIYRPQPTAAFSPRDTTLVHYRQAADAMTARGFMPVERRAGGQLAVYDGNALVIDLVAAHDDPREHVTERFRIFSGAIADTLRNLGADARVGAVAGEYCPGDYSINGEGRIKLAGVAQRIGRRGYHIGAVISVAASEAAREAVAEAYRILDMPFDPSTFGALDSLMPRPGFATLRRTLQAALALT